jgi:hypothetical protein
MHAPLDLSRTALHDVVGPDCLPMGLGLPVTDGRKATFSIAIVVSTVDVPCF